MILKRMVLRNFLSFYGMRALEFKRGLSFVVGSCGSGKTSLARAFRFAILGRSDIPRGLLINLEHKRDCLKRRKNATCSVKVELEHNNRNHIVAQSGISLVEGKKIRQHMTADLRIDEIFNLESLKHVYLNPMSPGFEEVRSFSSATRLTHTVIRHLNRNLRADIKFAILDGVLQQLDGSNREKLLSSICDMELDQLILMEARVPQNLEDSLLRFSRIRLNEE